MNKIRILFDSYHLYHLPQFDPLIDLLSRDSRFQLFHSTCSENKKVEIDLCLRILNSRPGEVIYYDNESERAKKVKELNLDVFICGWSRYPIHHFVNAKTIVGMMYHGIGVKPSYWRDNSDRLDIRFVEGEYRINQLREKGVKTKLALTGFTKLDPLFNNDNKKLSVIKKSLNIDSTKKTILFAPTFYPSSIEKFGIHFGELTKNFNVILKPHMWTFFLDNFSEYNLKPQRNLVYELAEKFNHIKLLKPEIYNIVPYYQISDLLLTEASSTIYEMIALQKPVVVNRFFKLKLSHKLFRYRLFKKRLSKKMNDDISNFCFEMYKPDEIKKTIRFALENKDKKVHELKKYQKKMLYKLDGKCAVRVRDEILNML